MQWNKYIRTVASNLVVGKCLEEIVGPPTLRWSGTHQDFKTLQVWVEKQLRYVAVRPWANLDLNLRNVETSAARAHYSVFYHIQGTDRSPERRRFLWGEDNEPLTIQETLEDIVDWFGLYWAKQPGCSLVFDAVVRDAHGTVSDKKYPEQTVNIWLSPVGFMPSTTS